MGLDLTALEGLNIPEITIDSKDQIEITLESVNSTETEVTEQNNTIGEVGSFDDFNKEEPVKEIVSDKGDETVEVSLEDNTSDSIEVNTEEVQEDSIIKGLAEWAKSEQIIDFKDEEFQDDIEFLKSKFNEKNELDATKRFEEKLAEDPDVLIELRKNFKDGVPLDELIYTESRIIEYSNYTEDQIKEDVNLQKKLVIDYLMNNDYEEDEAKVKVDKYEDSGILEDEALSDHKKLIKYEHKYKQNLIDENKKVQEAQKADYENRIKQIETQITSLDEIIPGIAITKEDKQKLVDGYLRVDKNRKTDLMKMLDKDPLAQLKIAQFFLQLGGDLEKVKVKAKTEAVKETKKAVTTYKDTPGIGKLNMNTIRKAVETAKKQRQQI